MCRRFDPAPDHFACWSNDWNRPVIAGFFCRLTQITGFGHVVIFFHLRVGILSH